jgi:CBS domain-containing protein
MKVEQVMTRPVKACRADQSVVEAARIMWEGDCGCVPVVQAADGLDEVVVGMITDRDVCMAAYTQGRPLGEIQVASAMARDVATCLPEDSITTALGIMETRQIRRLPVVDSWGRLVGMLSISDLAEEAARERARVRKDVTPARIGEVLGGIAAPREHRTIQAA